MACSDFLEAALAYGEYGPSFEEDNEVICGYE
jgi:hypothetical protein